MKCIILPLLFCLQLAFSQTPADYSNKGSTLNGQGDYEEAIKQFDKAISIDSTYAAAYNDRGFAKDKLEDYEGAIADFKKALKYNKGKFCISCSYLNIGLAYGKMNKLDRAVENFKKAIEIKPTYGEAYYDLGYAYHLQEKKS